MNIYSIRLTKGRTRVKPCNYNEFSIFPAITVGVNDAVDYRNDNKKEATTYFVTLWWLNFTFSIELWCDREETKGGER